MPRIPLARRLAATDPGQGQTEWAVGLYDFATDGGAVGDITLRGDVIPAGAIITETLLHIDVAPTSGGAATLAVRAESAGDIAAAAAVSGAPWSTIGAKRGTLTATSTPVKTTVNRPIIATVASAALTAGRIKVFIGYIEFKAEV